VLRRLVQQAAEQLGLPEGSAGSIDARLYKLLLYEQGGHFAAHQDTEKEPGMFGTLVVQLPCAGGHQGGRLLVRHGGGSFEQDFAQVGGCWPLSMPRGPAFLRACDATAHYCRD
jgi:hypothetical protein